MSANTDANSNYDAVLVVSFGGPEGNDDVIPFLENVLRGRPVPRERMLEVAEHYYHFGGVSPLNSQVRDLLDALRPNLKEAGVDLPVYWGNRNWHPLLVDTVREMQEAGVRRVLALVLSAYSCYSGCRQYREDIYRACDEVGADAADVDKIRVFYNHPDFVAANSERLAEALGQLPGEQPPRVAFTAHSIPMSMATTSDYERQLTETSRLVAEACSIPEDRWDLVYQSRSGRPQDPWLEPDICDHIATLADGGTKELVIMPIGFLSDHMEVMFDLDEEARQACDERGMVMARAKTVGTHPKFVSMLTELIRERLDPTIQKRACGLYPPNHDVCPTDCCPAPQRPGRPAPQREASH